MVEGTGGGGGCTNVACLPIPPNNPPAGGGGGSGIDSDTCSNSCDVDFSGYSDWETALLRNLFDNGGSDAAHAVIYILVHNIHIRVGNSFNWQSRIDSISAWYNWSPMTGDQYIYLSPNIAVEDEIPGAWALSLIAHEGLHLEQGPYVANSQAGEMEAWIIGIQIAENLGHKLSERDELVLKATTVGMFSSTIETEDPDYWNGLSQLPTYSDSDPVRSAIIIYLQNVARMNLP